MKGLTGPSGFPGPAGPKGERVSIYVCVFSILIYCAILGEHTFHWFSSQQGEKGNAGFPGPIGPQGIPVSL